MAGESVVGNIRVQALSPTLIRIEPKGPLGFENRTTFNVVNRAAFQDDVKISVMNTTQEGTWLATMYHNIHIGRDGSQITIADAEGSVIWSQSGSG